MKITVFGNFGSSNYGNELTLLTLVSYLRARYPAADYCCVCPNPRTVQARYDLDAVPIALGRQLWRANVLRRYLSALELLRRSDIFVIPGTGLLTDAYGFPDWGLYSVFKWSLMARVCRCKIVFLSVGAGPIYSAKGRRLARLALSLAHYRSYRDDASKSCLVDIGVRVADDPVYPDLVFALPRSEMPSASRGSRTARPVVGLGLMVYAGKYSRPDSTQSIYVTYLDTLVTLTKWLVEHGYDVRLLAGDDDDEAVIREFLSLLDTRLGPVDRTRVVHQQVTSLENLLDQIGNTDLVVATRFHNILLALLLGKPVVAISFHHKSSALMKEIGLSGYIHDINHMDAQALVTQVQDAENNVAVLSSQITGQTERLRGALDEQFSLLFAGV